MFADTNIIESKIEKFLFRDQKHQMVVGRFISYRNIGKDADVIKLVSQLQEKTGRDDGLSMLLYAQRRIYTLELSFNWHPQTPPFYRSLEDWWTMVDDGESEEDCYLFYINNCHNIINDEWQNALNEALTIWTPPEEGWDLAEGEIDEEPPSPSTDPLGLEKPKSKRKVADPN